MTFYTTLPLSPSQIRELIRSKLNCYADRTVSAVEQSLCEDFGAEDVQLLNSSSVHVHGKTLFKNALDSVSYVSVVLPVQLRKEQDTGGVSRPVAPTSGTSADSTVARLIRALDQQERTREFVWAGYVVKSILPALGISDETECQGMLDRLVANGIVAMSKRPNPKNPAFPTTTIQ
jgi:hypothetical protein